MKVAGSFPAGIGSRLKLLNTYFLLIRAGLGRILPGRSGPAAAPGAGAAPASLPSGWGGVTGRGDAAEKPLNTRVPHRWPHAASPLPRGGRGARSEGIESIQAVRSRRWGQRERCRCEPTGCSRDRAEGDAALKSY